MHTRTRTKAIWRWAAWAIALTLSLGANGLALAGVACSAHSPAHRVALVELYSSEGCSSCPPADRWLSQLHDGSPGADIVPLELHVDYWNSLGWTDRFSQHRFTERQEDLAAFAGGHLIYTPEVFVDGREMRDWGASGFDGRLRELAAQPAQADVAIRLAPVTSGAASQGSQASGTGSGAAAGVNTHAPHAFDVDAQFSARSTAPRTLNAYVAIYENQVSSQVDAGENHGATLHHDRVVREWLGPVPLVGGVARIRRDVALAADASDTAPPGRFGVAAFVEDAETGDVLQAADLPACR